MSIFDMNNVDLGRWIRKNRRAVDLTQGDLGKKLGYSHSPISRWERGEDRPSDANIEKMREIFTQLNVDRDEREAKRVPVVGIIREAVDESVAQALEKRFERAPDAVPMDRLARVDYFRGREEEIRASENGLEPGKVVTLWGAGGMGKTAIAAEVLQRLYPAPHVPSEKFRDGVVVHRFSRSSSGEAALTRISTRFKVKPIEGETPADTAARAVRAKRVLVVLDDAQECDDSELDVVLEVCSGAAVLMMTHKRGQARGTVVPVGPLPEEEAKAVLKAWANAPESEAAVTRIVQLVGGLPLALRLAGSYMERENEAAASYLAWLEEHPLEAVHGEERREESVLIVLRNSVDRLSPPAQTAMKVIGALAPVVFPREVVAHALGYAGPHEVRRPLGELVKFGLVRGADGWYEVSHPLVHVYARQRMALGREALRRLGEYFAAIVDELWEQEVINLDKLEWLSIHGQALVEMLTTAEVWEQVLALAQRIDECLRLAGYRRERVEILHAVLLATNELGDAESEAAVVVGLAGAYMDVGDASRSIELYKQALEMMRGADNRWGEGSVLGNLGITLRQVGEYQQTIGYLEQALATSREFKNPSAEGLWLENLGLAYLGLGQVQVALGYLELALAISRQLGDQRAEANRLGGLGNAYFDLGDAQQAAAYHKQALAIHEEVGDRQGQSNDLSNLGNCFLRLGDVRRAIECHEKALGLRRQLGDRRGEATDLGNLANAYSTLGEDRKAIEYGEQALAIRRNIGDRPGQGISLSVLGNAYRNLRDWQRAIDYYERALAIARQIGDRHGESSRLGNLGMTYRETGETRRAIEFLEMALAICRETGARHGEGLWLGNLGVAHMDLKQPREAIGYYDQALEISRQLGTRREEAIWLGNLAKAYAALGEAQRVVDYYEQALAVSREIEDRSRTLRILDKLGEIYFAMADMEHAMACLEEATRIRGGTES